jgi:hypothetical protein
MAAGGAAAAAMANAIKASGAIVRLDPDAFQRILWKVEDPLVVTSETRFFGTTYKYIFGYRGLVFYTKSAEPLRIGGKAEIISAKSIWIPQ